LHEQLGFKCRPNPAVASPSNQETELKITNQASSCATLNATTPSEFAIYWLFETTSTARAAGINNITGP